MAAAMMKEKGRRRGRRRRRRRPRWVCLWRKKGWPPRATAAAMQATMAATMSDDGSDDGDGSGDGEETVDGRKAPSAARRRPFDEAEGPRRFPAFPRSGGWRPRVCVCRLSRSNLDLCT